MRTGRRSAGVLLCASLLATGVSLSFAATQAAEQMAKPPRLTGAHRAAELMVREARYALLFRHIVRFEDHVRQLAQQGKEPRHKERYELPDDLYAMLLATAKTCVAEMEKLDREMAAVKEKYRDRLQWDPARGSPPPKELQELEQQRRELILRAVAQIEDRSGPAQFALFDTRVKFIVGYHYPAVPTQ